MFDPSPSYSAFQAIGFATGFALCLLLGSLQWQANREQKDGVPYLWLWGVCIVWNAANFAQHSLILAGYPIDSRTVGITALIAWAPMCVSSTLITWTFYRAFPSDSMVRKAILAFSVLSGAALATLLVSSVLASNPLVSFRTFVSLVFAYGVLHAAICGVYLVTSRRIVVSQSVVPPLRKRFSRIATMTMLLWLAAGAIALFTDIEGGLINLFAQTLAQQWVIPLAILISVLWAEASFADVVLKRTLRLILSMTMGALLAYFALDLESGLPLVIATIAGATVILIAPWLHSSIGRLVDKVILRRPDYERIANQFAAAVDRAETPAEVVALLNSTAHDALKQRARLAEAITIDIPLHHSGEVKVNDALSHHFMQGELGFIRTMRTHASRRIDVLASEAERREAKLREERLKHAITEAELFALRAQVNPHFLFNTLNSIVELISTAPQVAEAMTERLAEFFRYTLARSQQPLSTIREELEFTRHYLEIESIRFGERLRIQIDGDVRLGDIKVPSLILQPLVENAVRHGIAPKLGGGTVWVNAQREGQCVQLSVRDDGVGMHAANSFASNGSGIGLQNVRERLKSLHGDKAFVTITDGMNGCGTSVTLVLPIDGN